MYKDSCCEYSCFSLTESHEVSLLSSMKQQ
jgi:hypothetical protein